MTTEYTEREGYLILSSNGTLSRFPFSTGWAEGEPITISAIWGQVTPEDVKAAVIELVINLARETDPASLKLVGIDNQPLRESLPPRVAMIAKKYRAKGIAFV